MYSAGFRRFRFERISCTLVNDEDAHTGSDELVEHPLSSCSCNDFVSSFERFRERVGEIF